MRLCILLIAAGLASFATIPAGVAGQVATTHRGSAISGREIDLEVARIAHRLAVVGRGQCPALAPVTGLVLQHLTQFRLADRAGMAAAYGIDRGPGVVAVVDDSAAARAGLVAGDVLLAVDGAAIPVESRIAQPFDQRLARSRADAVLNLVQRASSVRLSVLRGGARHELDVMAEPACPSRVHLARSDQRNAYADGVHVFLTTALVDDASEDERAFMISHEMAHNILGHAAVMRGPDVKRGVGRMLGRSRDTIRAIERAADALAADLMLDAGYDPIRGIGVLRRLGGDLRIGLLSAHDSVSDRVAAMRARAAARPAP